MAKHTKNAKAKSARKEKSVGITPLGDRVLVRRLSDEESGVAHASGIIIPETVDKEKLDQGEVIAVGEGKYEDGALVKPPVTAGDRIVFSRYGYDDITVGGEEYLIVKSDNILATIA